MTERIPPQALEAEQAVLGSMLVEPEAIESATEILRPGDYYREAHRAVHESILHLHEKGEPVDLLSLRERLAALDHLERIGGPVYLIQLQNAVPSAANVRHYADLVRKKAVRRAIISAANKMLDLAYDAEFEDDALPAECGRLLESALSRSGSKRNRKIRDIVDEVFAELEDAYERKGALVGVPTGFYDLDRATNGWQRGDLILVAARPGMGKTAVTVNTFAQAALAVKKRVVIFSLEMSDRQLVKRQLASMKQVSSQYMTRGIMSDAEWARIGEGCSELNELPITIDDNCDITVADIRTKIRQVQRSEGKVDLVVIDYLALINSDNHRDKEHLRIGEMTRGIKKLAKEFDLPIILAAQVNKEVDRRSDGRPLLADVKEAGEADADIVIFLWPDKVPPTPEAKKEGVKKIWLSVAKHRNGPQGDIPLAFHGAWTRFDQMVESDETPKRSAPQQSQVTSSSTLPTRPTAYKDNDGDLPVSSSSAPDIEAWNR